MHCTYPELPNVENMRYVPTAGHPQLRKNWLIIGSGFVTAWVTHEWSSVVEQSAWISVGCNFIFVYVCVYACVCVRVCVCVWCCQYTAYIRDQCQEALLWSICSFVFPNYVKLSLTLPFSGIVRCTWKAYSGVQATVLYDALGSASIRFNIDQWSCSILYLVIVSCVL